MPELFIGPAGWNYPDWKGVVYPPRLPRSVSELNFLAGYLDLVEVNSTFYRIPAAHTAISWLEQVRHNPRFRFILKLWQGFTHEGRPADAAEMGSFKHLLEPLQQDSRLLTILVQFPWSCKRSGENLIVLDKIVKALAPAPCHAEFRHSSWHTPEVLTYLRDHGIGWVNIDQPVIGASLGPTRDRTSSLAYFRFHGRNYAHWFREGAGRDQRYDYHYSLKELSEWLPQIQENVEQSDKTIVIFNNHFKGQAFANCLQLLALLTDSRPAIPEPLAAHFPELRAIGTLPPTQGTLPLF
ncbi:MAG TPA: DUF72 domain-containing protein [bacterium]|nr:DUF72 domain-containing protein [bacterium]